MPRILPRLLQKLADEGFGQKENVFGPKPARRVRTQSLRKRLPPPPSFTPAERTQSILLDPVNPVANAADYVRHKSLPPRVRVPRRAAVTTNTEYDRPRRMTTQERDWWASPYRMYVLPM